MKIRSMAMQVLLSLPTCYKTTRANIVQLHEQNPLVVPGITDHILCNLKTTSMSQPGTDKAYRNVLIDQNIFPWLWDIDSKLVREADPAMTKDWKLLVQCLSSDRLHDPEVEVLTIPKSLQNRRRIWRLLEVARFGDIAREQEKSMADETARRRESARNEKLPPRPEIIPPGFESLVLKHYPGSFYPGHSRPGTPGVGQLDLESFHAEGPPN